MPNGKQACPSVPGGGGFGFRLLRVVRAGTERQDRLPEWSPEWLPNLLPSPPGGPPPGASGNLGATQNHLSLTHFGRFFFGRQFGRQFGGHFGHQFGRHSGGLFGGQLWCPGGCRLGRVRRVPLWDIVCASLVSGSPGLALLPRPAATRSGVPRRTLGSASCPLLLGRQTVLDVGPGAMPGGGQPWIIYSSGAHYTCCIHGCMRTCLYHPPINHVWMHAHTGLHTYIHIHTATMLHAELSICLRAYLVRCFRAH